MQNTINIKKMKRLPPELQKNGFQYTLILRGHKSCIYKQHVTATIKHFEVFLIKTMPAKEIFGKQYPAREIFPANEDFGYTAWSCFTLDNAMNRFNHLENKLYILKFLL